MGFLFSEITATYGQLILGESMLMLTLTRILAVVEKNLYSVVYRVLQGRYDRQIRKKLNSGKEPFLAHSMHVIPDGMMTVRR